MIDGNYNISSANKRSDEVFEWEPKKLRSPCGLIEQGGFFKALDFNCSFCFKYF
jgi:hypothetical protein